MAPRHYDEYPYYPQSRPIQAEGGIKSRTKRGQFGQNWWARRWLSVLESLGAGSRLERGRAYARQGQVLSIEVREGVVAAKVQGSRRVPYDVSISVKPLSDKQWMKVGKHLAAEASFAAKLMAGEMPENVEEAFLAARVSLFPNGRKDLRAACSCPDWENPCKHIAAVYYLMGEEFDRDPFLVFRLRGMDRDSLLSLIGTVGTGCNRAETQVASTPTQQEVQPQEQLSSSADHLPVDIHLFWIGHDPKDAAPPSISFGELNIPKMPAPWVRRLGQVPFWRGEEDFLTAMEDVYSRASQVGLQAFLGEIFHNAHDIEPPGF